MSDHAIVYPGPRHDGAYAITDGGNVVDVRWMAGHGYCLFTDDGWEHVAGWREGYGHQQLVPVIAYGALGSPARLLARFGWLCDGIVVLPATMSGVARAWTVPLAGSRESRKLPRGAPYTLVNADTTHREATHVLLLPADLGPLLDRIEGRPAFYKPVRLNNASVTVEHLPTWRNPLAYLGYPPFRHAAISPVTGEPVLVSRHPDGVPATIPAEDDPVGAIGGEAYRWLPEHVSLPSGKLIGANRTTEDAATFGEMI